MIQHSDENTDNSTSDSAAFQEGNRGVDHLSPLCHGLPALTGIRRPWMDALLSDPEQCAQLIREFGSPVNLHDFGPFIENVSALRLVASKHEVPFRIFAARKANKTNGVLEVAKQTGIGVDVASLRELETSLARHVSPSDIIVTAAVKPDPLLRLAVRAGTAVSIDNDDELMDILRIADQEGVPARVALRLAVVAPGIAPTRFGLSIDEWGERIRAKRSEVSDTTLKIEGLHFHLNGYDIGERVTAIEKACEFAQQLNAEGHQLTYVDVGGGFPVQYLADETQWRSFWQELADINSSVTWREDDLGLSDPAKDRPSSGVYPFWQRRTAAQWLDEILTKAAPALTRAQVALHCEPGRALLDGCGMTLAKVAFRKRTSDGVPIIGLHMNRTQLRSTSRDFLVDPVLVRPKSSWEARDAGPAREGFLVGAYCIEEELIMRRKLGFPQGVSREDIIAFINTGGYMMHILESGSHQIPLAANITRSPLIDVSLRGSGKYDDVWVRDEELVIL